MVEKVEIEALHQFYKTLSELVGTEAMLRIYQRYRGTQLNIPIHLYERKVSARRVIKEFDGNNQMELYRKYGYSQKWVYKVLKHGE